MSALHNDENVDLVYRGQPPNGMRNSEATEDWEITGCGRKLTFHLMCDGACVTPEACALHVASGRRKLRVPPF